MRQGDPISHFLFLVVVECFSRLMSLASEKGFFKAAEIDRDKVLVSHLQFVDDTILMGEGGVEDVKALKRILVLFEMLSGLKINFSKCNIYGVNMDSGHLSAMADILGCSVGSFPFTYLGIKMGFRHKRAAEWTHLVQKVRRKLLSWENKQISMGGRITLLNAVLSFIPIYYFSFYLIPKKTLNELIKIQRDFLWGGGPNSKKVAWIEWKRICMP